MRRTARPIQTKTPVLPGVPDNLALTLACQQARLGPPTSVTFDAEVVANADPPPLLVSRKNARQLLGNVHMSTLWRLEKSGRLIPRRLNPNSKTSAVFYLVEDIKRIARGEG